MFIMATLTFTILENHFLHLDTVFETVRVFMFQHEINFRVAWYEVHMYTIILLTMSENTVFVLRDKKCCFWS